MDDRVHTGDGCAHRVHVLDLAEAEVIVGDLDVAALRHAHRWNLAAAEAEDLVAVGFGG